MSLESFRADFDPKVERFATALDVRINDQLKLTTKHRNVDGIVSTDLTGKRWKVGYDFVKKTAYGQVEHKFDTFDLKVKQSVPEMNWSVVPSPELEIDTTLVEKEDFSDRMEIKYDMNKRLAAIEEKFKIGSKHEVILAADSATGFDGTSFCVKTKVGKPYAKIVSGKYSKMKGPVFSYTVDPTSRLGVKMEAALNPKAIKGEVSYRPEQAENAEVGFNFMKPFNSTTKSSTGIFVKWNIER